MYVGVGTDGVQNAGLNASNVALAMETAIERWNEQSGTTIRLVSGGLTSNTTVSSGILIRGVTGCTTHPASHGTGLVHELGHTMGRNDAYNFPTSCDLKACALAHETVMTCTDGQDLTDFDRTDHQSVYGDRAP